MSSKIRRSPTFSGRSKEYSPATSPAKHVFPPRRYVNAFSPGCPEPSTIGRYGISRQSGGSLVSDAFTVASETEHTYDWVLHVQGELSSKLQFEPSEPPASANGYQHIEKWERAGTDSDWEATWINGAARLTLRMKAAPGTEVYRGFGPGRDPAQRVALILVRRRGAKTLFQAEMDTASR